MTTAASAPPARRRRWWVWVLAAVGVLLVVGLTILVTALVVGGSRGAPSQAATPAPTPATPVPSAQPSPPADQAQAHQQYRAYVSTVIQSGTAVVASLINLEDCRSSRPACVQHLNNASDQVQRMQNELKSTPAPPCLAEADQRLQDALTFQQRGLETAREGVVSQNRVQAIQGLLLTSAGLWRASQAIVEGRQANC